METQATTTELSINELQDEIATLAAHIDAASYQLLKLIAELDERGGWADPLESNGFRSCAHWLSWRIGLEPGAARQHVRVARALTTLPKVSEAFARGELSYSKVRAITRIASPETEDTLLGWAKAGTAAHVEKLVRAYRRAAPKAENDRAMAQREGRTLRVYYDDDGMLVLQGRLAPEQGALLLQALEAARRELRDAESGSAEPDSATDRISTADLQQAQADALVRLAERSLAAGAVNTCAADRYQVVVHVDAEVLTDPAADGRSQLEDGPAIAAETSRRLACDASLCVMTHGPDGELVPGRKTRVVSAPLRRALRARDGNRCMAPGCSASGTDAHHVVHWANGGPTVLGNMLLLCGRCHTQVHEGGFRVEALAEGGFRFFRPDGEVIPDVPPAPALPANPVRALEERNAADGLAITPYSAWPTWEGEPVDYAWMVEDLLSREPEDERDRQTAAAVTS